jgi:hypothetical protein
LLLLVLVMLHSTDWVESRSRRIGMGIVVPVLLLGGHQ